MIDFKDVSNCLAKLILTRNSSSLIASLVSCQVRYIKVLIQKDISGYIHAPMVGKLLVKYRYVQNVASNLWEMAFGRVPTVDMPML